MNAPASAPTPSDTHRVADHGPGPMGRFSPAMKKERRTIRKKTRRYIHTATISSSPKISKRRLDGVVKYQGREKAINAKTSEPTIAAPSKALLEKRSVTELLA